jgi:hypothetical protein
MACSGVAKILLSAWPAEWLPHHADHGLAVLNRLLIVEENAEAA